MKPITLALAVLFLAPAAFSASHTTPNNNFTPGVLCTESDPDFDKLDYAEKIARCKRNVNEEKKMEIAHNYGDIPKSEWHNYEFDHLIPLCAGGSSDARNIWPQPITEAHEKDKIEDEVCAGLRKGTMTQDEAVQKVHDWFDERVAE
jgi:hypothetical protein